MASLINNEKYSRYYRQFGMVYQRPEIKASLEVIFSVFTVILLIFLAIRPTLTNLAALQKRILDKESISSKADKKIAQLFVAQEEINTNLSSLSLYRTAVPDKFSYLEIIGRVELLARNTGVSADSLSILGTKLIGDGKPVGDWSTKILKTEVSGLMIIPIDFQISGRTEQVKKFLIDVENMDRLGVIKTVNLVKESGSSKGSEKIKATGQISFYVYTEKK